MNYPGKSSWGIQSPYQSQANVQENELPHKPSEPTILAKAGEIRMRMSELEQVHSALAEGLYGYREQCEKAPVDTPDMPNLEGLLGEVSTRLAQSVGFARTMLERMGHRG